MYLSNVDQRPLEKRLRSPERLWQLCLALAAARRENCLPEHRLLDSSLSEARLSEARLPDARPVETRLVETRLADSRLPDSRVLGCRLAGPDHSAGLWFGHGSDDELELSRTAGGDWCLGAGWSTGARALFELYRPLLAVGAAERFVLAHLGQSIDGRIATLTGDSRYVSCTANLIHLHRLRALCDAVLIGRQTATADDPMLTTRLVAGPNPVRVIIDPHLRMPAGLQVLADDRAPTLVACDRAHLADAGRRFPATQVVGVAALPNGRLDPRDLCAQLADRGLHVLFVEGGGVTVSQFVEAGCVDSLHVAVAPVLVGAGREGLQLAGAPLMRDNRRPAHRLFRMGSDILWDFDLRPDSRHLPTATDLAADEGGVTFLG